MVRKTFKKILATAITSTMMMTSTTFAITESRDLTLNEVIERLRETPEDEITKIESKLDEYRISSDINISTEENVNVIVEFQSEPIAISSKAKTYAMENVESDHEVFRKFVEKMNNNVYMTNSNNHIKINSKYKAVFNGIAVTLRGSDVEKLLECRVVKKIWNDYEVTIDMPVIYENEDVLKPYVDSNKSLYTEKVYTKRGTEDTLSYLGVDRLHDEGIRGSGIKIGVIDTGVDYNHPELNSHFKGRKYIGYDFVNNDYDPMETTYDEWNNSGSEEVIQGSTYYTSHGTHVSGIVSGKGESKEGYTVRGVAPEAELYVYKVLGAYGKGTTSDVMSGLEKAVEDGMDVVNLSIGANINNPMYPTSIAVNNMAKIGIVPVVAAGNNGDEMYTVGAPGTSPLAITVGANSTDLKFPTFEANAGSININAEAIGINIESDLNRLEGKKLGIVNAWEGKLYNYANIDAKGKIVLLNTGGISIYEKIKNAKKKGAEAIFLYSLEGEGITGIIGEKANIIDVFKIDNDVAKKLIEEIKKEGLEVSFNNQSIYTIKGGNIATFSSRGPIDRSFDIKPDLLASGVNVFSTIPEFINHKEQGENYSIAYGRSSGTSMAAPHVAGIAALILQENPEYTVEMVKLSLMNNARGIEDEVSIFETGAGIVDAYEAVHENIHIKVENSYMDIKDHTYKNEYCTGSARFGQVYVGDELNLKKNLILENNSDESVVYNLSYKFTGKQNFSEDGLKNNIEILIPETIEVPNGEKVIKKLGLNIPENAQHGIYEGIILLENQNNIEDIARIPFAVRYSESGIDFDVEYHAMSTKLINADLRGYLKVNSKVEYVDYLLLDGLTEKPIGYFGRFNGEKIYTGIPYKLNISKESKYFQLTGTNDNPVSNRLVDIDEGYYKVAAVAVSTTGESYIIKEDMIINNELRPNLIIDDYRSIIEINESMITSEGVINNLYFNGKISSDMINRLNEMGHKDINQSDNRLKVDIMIPNNANSSEESLSMNGIMELKENGDFTYTLQNAESYMLPLALNFTSSGYGEHENYKSNEMITLVNEGQTYYYMDSPSTVNINEVYLNEIYVKNLNGVNEIRTAITADKKKGKIHEVKASKEIEEYAESIGGKVDLEIKGSRITLSIKDKEGKNIIMNNSDSMKILNVYTETYITTQPVINNTYVRFITVGEDNELSKWPLLVNQRVKKIEGKDKYEFKVRIELEGLGGINEKDIDEEVYRNINAYLINNKGERVNLEYNKSSKIFSTDGIESGDKVEFIVEAPGYMKFISNFIVDKDESVIIKMIAGDVDGNNIVDLRDIIELQRQVGLDKVNINVDLNNNGMVDEIDLYFVVKNYGKSANTAEKPVKEVNGKTIKEYLTSSQLERGIFFSCNVDSYEFIQGESINLKLEIGNMSIANPDYAPIQVAQYDNKGKLIQLKEHLIYLGDVPSYNSLAVDTLNAATKVKVLIWDNMDDINILHQCLEFYVK